MYRPAGLWQPVGDPSHVLWDVAAPSDDPGESRNTQKTRFGGGSRGRRRAYRRVSASSGRIRAFDGRKISFPPQTLARLALGFDPSPSVLRSFLRPTNMPPRGNTGGRAAAATDGGSPQARATPQTEPPAGDVPGTLADIPVDLGALDNSGGEARAAHLHQLQQYAFLAQAAQQQPWLFSGIGGAPAPPPQPPPQQAADFTSVLAALSSIESRIAERLLPLEAGLNDLRTTVASPSSAPAPAGGRGRVAFDAAPPRARAASPAGSATDSEAVSRASTDDPSSSLDALLGVASADLAHDLKQSGLSPAWAAAVKNTGSKLSADDIVNLSTLLIVGRMFQHLSYLVYDMCDNTVAVPRDQLESAIPHIDVARDALIARLNHYQLVASGLDTKSAAALAEAAAFKRRVARHGDGVLAGLPIACSYLAEIFADFQKKAMDKAVKACHDPPAKTGKPAALPDDDDIDSLRTQLEKSEAHAKKLADRLSEANRKAQGPRDPKDPDSRSRAPKKADKPKSPAPLASADADASA